MQRNRLPLAAHFSPRFDFRSITPDNLPVLCHAIRHTQRITPLQGAAKLLAVGVYLPLSRRTNGGLQGDVHYRTGKPLEEKVREHKISTLLALGPDGTAAIKGLLIDGERHEDPPLF